MNPKKNLLVILTLAVLVLTACAGKADTAAFAPTESSIYITRDGKITSAIIEKYEGGDYSEEELRASAQQDLEAIKGQYAAADGQSAAITECTIKDGTIKLLVEFPNSAAYLSYLEAYPDETDETVTSIDITTVADGLTKGYLLDAGFTKPNSAQPVKSGDITKQSDLHVAAVTGSALIQPEGKIQYVSENVTITSGNMVRTPSEGVSYIVFK